MDPLSITAGIINIIQLTGDVIKWLNDVKGASKDRAQCAIDASNLHTLLITLRFRLGESSCEDAWYGELKALGVEGGPLDQYRQALELLQSKLGGRDRFHMGKAVVWNISKGEVASVLSRMERLKTLILIALEMDHFKLSEAIKGSLDDIGSTNAAIKDDTSYVRSCLPALQDGLDAVQLDKSRQQHQAVMQWLSSIDMATQQADYMARRQAGTGQWFLESSEFQEWITTPKATLFCPGIPGAGKTMIAAMAIDYIRRTVQSGTHGLAYLYCNYKTQADYNITTLLATLMKQLLQARSCIPEPISCLHDFHLREGTRPTLEEIFDALRSVLKTYSTVYVVIDALDECPNKDGTRSWLVERILKLQSDANLSLMATSRAIPEVMEQLKPATKLEIRANDNDVKQFLAAQIYRLPKCIQRSDELRCLVEEKIAEAIDGMFLLARLHVDSLSDKNTRKEVKVALEKLSKVSQDHTQSEEAYNDTCSKAYDEAYDEAIKSIDSQLSGKRTLARRVLSWITYAQRPLRTEELCHALAVEPGEEELDHDNLPDVEDIVSVCAGLVTVDEESDVIRLVHYTTEEYFVRIRESWNPCAQREIATTCLTYLSHSAFRSGSCPNDVEFEVRTQQNAFLQYAAGNWAFHTQTVQEEVAALAIKFLEEGHLVSCAIQTSWTRQYDKRDPGYSEQFPRHVSGLQVASANGLLFLMKKLMSRSMKDTVNFKDSEGRSVRTPLSWAAQYGQEAAVKLLLESGDLAVDSKDETGRTPLIYAAWAGSEKVTRFLLQRADVKADAKDEKHRTPLSYAASAGHKTIVELLLGRKDVEADQKDHDNRTPLSYAAAGGHEAIVKILLECDDVEAEARDKRGRTPLSHAAYTAENEAVLSLLLNRPDVDPESRDKGGQTPLSHAADGGKMAAVKVLLERKDVDPHSKDRRGRTVLWYAARGRSEEVVGLLLDRHGVEADTKDADGVTPLMKGIWANREEVVRLFTKRDDVDLNSGDNRGQTPLFWAVRYGRQVVIKLLLESGRVLADAKAHNGRTPLSYAASRGPATTLKLLLNQHDVNPETRDDQGRTPLSWAAEEGCVDLAELLLVRGDVEADSRDWTGRTPLSWAAGSGKEAMVKLLLEREDVDANMQDAKGRTPLSWAAAGIEYPFAEGAQLAVVKLLLERAALPDLKDTDGRTPLSHAAQQGTNGVADLLLARDDFEAESKDAKGRTPLSWAAQGQGSLVAPGSQAAVVELLLGRYDADPESRETENGRTPLSYAAQHGLELVAKRLMQCDKVEPDSRNANGRTPLSWAVQGPAPDWAQEGRIGVVKLLLERKDIDINSMDNEGRTPLSWIAQYAGHRIFYRVSRPQEEVVKLLLERDDININAMDMSGRTPLSWAAQGLKQDEDFCPESQEMIVKLLLEHGNADVSLRDESGRSPLSYAVEEGHDLVVKLLESKLRTDCEVLDPDSDCVSRRQ